MMHVFVKVDDKTIYSGHADLPFRYFAALEGQPHYLEFGDHLQMKWKSERAFEAAMKENAVFVFCRDDLGIGAVYRKHPTVESLGRMVFFEQRRMLLDEQLERLKVLLPATTKVSVSYQRAC